MGFWIALFYVPVCVQSAHDFLFKKGEPGYAFITEPIQENSTDFESYWPNVVQLMFFTVYFNTGSTVKLGWQGLAGTFAASANYFVMGKMFPVGGKCKVLADPTVTWMRAGCAEYEDPNFMAYHWFIWADLIGFIFIILLTNAQENTMKFGMSWHLTYMGAFMSPNGFTPSHSVVVTSIIGVFLAILVTLVPKAHLTRKDLESAPKDMVKQACVFIEGAAKVMDKSIDMGHYKLVAEKFFVETKGNGIEGMVDRMKSCHATSWWESFDLGRWGDLRARVGALIESFDDSIGGFDDVFFTLNKAVMSQDFETFNLCTEAEREEVRRVRQAVLPKVKAVNGYACAILEHFGDKFIQTGELPTAAMVQSLKQASKELETTYFPIIHGDTPQKLSAHRQALRTDLNVYIFATLSLSAKVQALSDAVAANRNAAPEVQRLADFVKAVWEGFLDTWKLRVCDVEKWMFAIRNTTAIGVTFLMGAWLSCNVFTPNSVTMCSTLAILISHFPGSAFYRNLMRLLGLTLGKVLPIIAMAFVSIFGNGTGFSEIIHVVVVWAYMTFFAFMYYTSPEWSLVGCLIAGFGCYGLVGVQSAMTPEQLRDVFVARYQELGAVTVAIMIQIFIDSLDTAVRRRNPRTIILKNMRKLGMSSNKADRTNGLLVEVYRAFFQKDWEKMAEHIRAAKGLISGQQALLSELQDKTIIIRGMSVPFKYKLCCEAVANIDKLLGEAEVLMCLNCSHMNNDKAINWTAINEHYQDFIPTLIMALRALQTALEQKDETKVGLTLRDISHYKPIADLTESVRVSTGIRTLHDAMSHTFEIAHLCYSSGTFKNSDSNA
eukprot:TRINITY_DN13386_c0_g1_i1.p1 TRINITY_DN13386_c0_g1~~TRINITY_DN13386_c0_g1_i1.p1  ORF type:complete len:916 (+),score=250.94 TRINITY_DN13386_c0_g1_i1:253-2748(+)